MSIVACYFIRCGLSNKNHEHRRQMYCTATLGHRWPGEVMFRCSSVLLANDKAPESETVRKTASRYSLLVSLEIPNKSSCLGVTDHLT